MSLSAIENLIEDKYKELDIISKKSDILIYQLEKQVPGILAARMIRKRCRYYWRKNIQDKSGRYLNLNEKNIIRILELKNFYQQLYQTALEEKKKLFQILEMSKAIKDIDSVYCNIPNEKRHLISPEVIFESPEKINEWKNIFVKRKKIESEIVFFTSTGLRVRSKSELIIAERFEANGIPYKYECPIFVDNQPWYPDFLVMNKKTGKEYYWEHFGLLDNTEYCTNVLSKMETYTKKGIVYGKNLIISAENSQHPLNTNIIDELINRFLL